MSAEVAAKESPLNKTIVALEKQIEENYALSQDLASRLVVISRSPGPSNSTEKGTDKTGVILLDELDKLAERVSSTNAVLIDLMNRIQV